jgi:metal-responsive CopG/Arc/MetJ family transcriptional regulator
MPKEKTVDFVLRLPVKLNKRMTEEMKTQRVTNRTKFVLTALEEYILTKRAERNPKED